MRMSNEDEDDDENEQDSVSTPFSDALLAGTMP